VNVEPSGPERTASVPSFASATLPTIARPRPAPGPPRAAGARNRDLGRVRPKSLRRVGGEPVETDDLVMRNGFAAAREIEQVTDQLVELSGRCGQDSGDVRAQPSRASSSSTTAGSSLVKIGVGRSTFAPTVTGRLSHRGVAE
jgi:hypothetical protein